MDIVAALIEQPDYQTARKYWNKLSERLKNEGSEVVTNCHRLKMVAHDGKMWETDAADVETILRLVQSVPSKTIKKCLTSFTQKLVPKTDYIRLT